MKPARTSGASGAVAVLVVAVLFLVTLGAQAQSAEVETPGTTIAIRSGNHSDFGRIVIDTTSKNAFTLDQDGDHLVVRLTGDGTLGSMPTPPRNVAAMKIDGSTLDLMLRHGAKVHSWRMDGRIVLDVMDDTGSPAGVPASKPDASPRPRPPLSMASSPELGGVRPPPPERRLRHPSR